jgi:hypothetical protein
MREDREVDEREPEVVHEPVWVQPEWPEELMAHLDKLWRPLAEAESKGDARAKWEVMQDFAESLGPLGTPLRQAYDRHTLHLWVATLAHWDVFATFTFKREGVSVAGCQRAFERYAAKYLRGCPIIYYIEANPTRGDGGHHIHAMAVCGKMLRSRLWELWFKKHGVCKIEPIRMVDQVASYCAKLSPYVTKSHNKGGLWWNVLNCHRSMQRMAVACERKAVQANQSQQEAK